MPAIGSAADRAGEDVSGGAPDGPYGCGPRILVLEEDAPLRGLLTAALREEGYEVMAVPDGAPHSAGGATAAPVLVLLDLRRPGAGGGLAVSAVAWGTAGPPGPLLLLSAGCEAERRAATAALGAAGSLPLPFDLEELLAAVRRLAVPARAVA